MKLQMIKVSEAEQSPTNTKGRTEGKEFQELVESIKQKGILQPVLARKISGNNGGTGTKIRWEVIAGNRRLAAAREAGLNEIPAHVVEMDDVEAREAQIVENLQRADVHPLDEGEAYRKLIEESKYETCTIAAKVGKSESYVKQRLFLTNLEPKLREAYRKEKMNDGHAVLIAKLGAHDQAKAFEAMNQRYTPMTVKELSRWIDENIYTELLSQPWLEDKAAKGQVGECRECTPNRASLFGPVKEGACTDTKCWMRKMQLYITFKSKQDKLVKVSTAHYNQPKGMLSAGDYVLIGKSAKDRCDHVRTAIIAHGSNLGRLIDICSDKKCEDHGRGHSGYSLSPAEKERRKKEVVKMNERKEKASAAIAGAVKKLKFPISQKHLDLLFDATLHARGGSVQQPVCKRLGIEVPKHKHGGRDYEKALRNYADTNDKKFQVVMEVLMPGFNSYDEKDQTLYAFLKKF